MSKRTVTYSRAMDWLAVIPLACALVVLSVVVVCLYISIYISAYVFPALGLGLILLGVISLSPGVVLIGVLFAGFGGMAYHEWFNGPYGDMKPLSKVFLR